MAHSALWASTVTWSQCNCYCYAIFLLSIHVHTLIGWKPMWLRVNNFVTQVYISDTFCAAYRYSTKIKLFWSVSDGFPCDRAYTLEVVWTLLLVGNNLLYYTLITVFVHFSEPSCSFHVLLVIECKTIPGCFSQTLLGCELRTPLKCGIAENSNANDVN